MRARHAVTLPRAATERRPYVRPAVGGVAWGP